MLQVAIPEEGVDGHYGSLTINLPPTTGHDYYYVCTNDVDDKMWIHQGVDTFVRFTVRVKEEETTLLPIPIQATLIVVLLTLSGLFRYLSTFCRQHFYDYVIICLNFILLSFLGCLNSYLIVYLI